MNLFIAEAAAMGLKEALKLALAWFALSAYLFGRGRDGPLSFFYLGLAVCASLVSATFFLSLGPEARETLPRLANYVFFVFYLGCVLALFAAGGRRWAWASEKAGFLIFPVTVFYFSPDFLGSVLFLRDLSAMKESAAPVYASSAFAFALSLSASLIVLSRLRQRASRFLDAGQLLIFLLLIKVVGGGVKGVAEFTLIPSLQRGSMKLIHDVVHQTFVFLLVPDHPLLRLTTWNFIGLLFGSNAGLVLTLALLLFPPLVFLYKSNTAPVAVPSGLSSGAEKRKHRARVLSERRTKSVPVAVFVLVMAASMVSAQGERASSMYNPAPRPVVEDKGVVVIPLNDPTMDLMDGGLHKFSLLKDGKAMALLVIRKPDGRLAVCLDACEICLPEGYGLSEGKAVCLYCMTPIPLETLGRPGGCNPIPIDAEVSATDIRVEAAEVARKWLQVNSGDTRKEAVE